MLGKVGMTKNCTAPPVVAGWSAQIFATSCTHSSVRRWEKYIFRLEPIVKRAMVSRSPPAAGSSPATVVQMSANDTAPGSGVPMLFSPCDRARPSFGGQLRGLLRGLLGDSRGVLPGVPQRGARGDARG